MRPVPYIGITGFRTMSEIDAAKEHLDTWSGPPLLMIGILMSSKTLRGEENRYPERYPIAQNAHNLLRPDVRCLNLIHYATDDSDTLGEQLDKVVQIGWGKLDGVQLNVRWPHPDALQPLQRRDYRIVLQLGRKALADVRNDPGAVALRLVPYRGLITDVLIDMSGGHGVPIDVPCALAIADALAATYPDLGIGVAGGLDAAALASGRLQPIFDRHPYVNIDAEGRLRDDDDKLDIDRLNQYLFEASTHTRFLQLLR